MRSLFASLVLMVVFFGTLAAGLFLLYGVAVSFTGVALH